MSNVQQNIGQLQLGRVNAVNDLSNALMQQDFQRQQQAFEMQQARAEAAQPGGSGGSTNAAYTSKKNAGGGTNFYDSFGNPVTAAQYFASRGGGAGDLLNFLKNDKDKTSQAAAKLLQEQGIEAAKAKYPYIFAGV